MGFRAIFMCWYQILKVSEICAIKPKLCDEVLHQKFQPLTLKLFQKSSSHQKFFKKSLSKIMDGSSQKLTNKLALEERLTLKR